MADKIKPRTLKGFRDYPPSTMIPREWIIETARRVYRSYGFCPMDTPSLEHLEILLGKGSDETDKQLYQFEDHGGRNVGLRFDLTVPLARFVAQHIQELGTPYKRYQIANVWRGENTQRGRYREFMQCDFDTIGTTSLTADIEMILVINDLLTELQVGEFTVHVNHRGILNGLLEKLNLTEKANSVLRALDKLAKIGAEKVRQELAAVAGADDSQTDQLLALTALTGTNEEMLAQAAELVAGSEVGEAGVSQLREALDAISATLPPEKQNRIQFAPSICRGLDYYTGIVLETTLNELPEIGSVASGGRYDNLADLYTKQQLPGVGASLGLDRLLAALEELNRLEQSSTTAQVFIPYFEADRRSNYLQLAAQLRAADIAVEFFPEAKKLGKQLQYANRRGFPIALVLGGSEFENQECQLKNLATGDSKTVAYDGNAAHLVDEIRQILS